MKSAFHSQLGILLVLLLLSLLAGGWYSAQENEAPTIRTTCAEVLLDFARKGHNFEP